ncbi:MAG: tRNA lysidine(34) synthetase TilS, partial [Pseudomonadota bacterium]
MADDRPIDDLEFDQLMAGVGLGHEGPRLAVAVSGGPDSLALAFLARRWVERRSGVLVGLTVDHGLRPEATAEAAFVKSLFGGWGLDHETLIWRPSGIGGAGQAAARKARYDLLLEACQRWTIFQLVIGHNQGDQGETLLQRLERQSGAVGLPAMRQAALRADVRLLRPLLSLPKPRLMATCAKAGIEPVNDPSNVDDRFDRPALRGMLNHQNPSRQARRHDALYSAAGRASEVASRLERRASEIQLACTLVRPHGYVWLDPVCLARTTPLVAERVLARIIGAVGGGDFLRGATLSDL